jgi:hypothetical protein
MSSSMNRDRNTLSRLKSRIRSVANANGVVSAADVRNVMRSRVDHQRRGGFVAQAFKDLVREGFLTKSPTFWQETNPSTGHKVTVYELV